MIPAAHAGTAVTISENVPMRQDEVGRYRIQNIYIFYSDGNDIMTDMSGSVTEILSRFLDGVLLIPMNSMEEMRGYLLDNPWLALYSFNSYLTGVVFNDRTVPWNRRVETHRNQIPGSSQETSPLQETSQFRVSLIMDFACNASSFALTRIA